MIVNLMSRWPSTASPRRWRKTRGSAWAWAFLASVVSLGPSAMNANAQSLVDTQLALVSGTLADSAKLSWELGTRAQAILSLNATGFSVYSSASLPPPTSTDAFGPRNGSALAPFFDIARSIVQNRTISNGNVTGPQPLMKDGSAADPASIGFAVLLANWTGQDGGKIDYAAAAKDQLDYLLEKVPRTSDGAISHRVSEVQLWSDFVYMVPPFLAYYGVLTSNKSLIAEAYNQIKLYRNHLRDSASGGLWKHILFGSSGLDPGYWSTGNGWAAGGMLRVLATMKHSDFSNSFKHEQQDLADWTLEIQTAMYSRLDSTNVFPNWVNQPMDSRNFYDAASTALIASTVYRLSLLWGYHHNLPRAERSRQVLLSRNSPDSASTSSFQSALQGMNHFTPNGYLKPVVNPHSFGFPGDSSPEAQAFVLELHSAWRDWVLDGSQGANGGSSIAGHGSMAAISAGVGLGVWLLF